MAAPWEKIFFHNIGKLYIIESETLCRSNFTKEHTSKNHDLRRYFMVNVDTKTNVFYYLCIKLSHSYSVLSQILIRCKKVQLI